MRTLGVVLIGIPLGTALYAYLGYPLILWLLSLPRRLLRRESELVTAEPEEWPTVSILLPAYNEEQAIAGALEALTVVDYPGERLQILVTSDGSTDRTDEMVRKFADRGVELLRIEKRGGKTAAENAAADHVRGEIVVNTDASIRVPEGSIKPLVAALGDPTVGVASGRDVSAGADGDVNAGESGYVGYEMWIRSLETSIGSIVGASGCFYAIRAELHRPPLHATLSRDFSSALRARRQGYRAVHVDDAVCLVPRTGSRRAEFRRKVRTMARGLDTLLYWRALMNPLRYGRFAWMLISHKLCRWMVPLTLPLAAVGLVLLSLSSRVAAAVLLAVAMGGALGVASLIWSRERSAPRILRLAGYVISANVAGLLAWGQLFVGRKSATWEPTRRGAIDPATAGAGAARKERS